EVHRLWLFRCLVYSGSIDIRHRVGTEEDHGSGQDDGRIHASKLPRADQQAVRQGGRGVRASSRAHGGGAEMKSLKTTLLLALTFLLLAGCTRQGSPDPYSKPSHDNPSTVPASHK